MVMRWDYEYICIWSYDHQVAPDITHKANSKQPEYEVRECEAYTMDISQWMDLAEIEIDLPHSNIYLRHRLFKLNLLREWILFFFQRRLFWLPANDSACNKNQTAFKNDNTISFSSSELDHNSLWIRKKCNKIQQKLQLMVQICNRFRYANANHFNLRHLVAKFQSQNIEANPQNRETSCEIVFDSTYAAYNCQQRSPASCSSSKLL